MRQSLHPVPMKPPPFSIQHAERVADPLVGNALRRWLKGRVPAEDVGDMVQAVLAELLPYRDPPETVEALIALGRQMLKNDLVDHYRHRKTVRGVEVQPRDETVDETVGGRANEQAWDEIDTKKRAEILGHLVERGALTAADLELLERTDAEGYRTVAQELGTNEVALRKRAQRKRALLEQKWLRYAAFGLPGLAIILLIVKAVQPPPPVGHAPPWTGTPDEPTPEERAAALRANAEHACGAAQWEECLDKLDQARDLDPDGEQDPKVQGLRAKAHAGLSPAPSSAPSHSPAHAPAHASAPAPSHALAPTPAHASAPAHAPSPAPASSHDGTGR
jgi:DNA-directed RNA polymerase specialized sigma24 family protein